MNISAENMLHALDNTDVSIFMYYPQERKVVIPEKVCRKFQCEPVYTGMPYSFAEKNIYPDDQAGFIDMYLKIHNGEKTASTQFRDANKGIRVCDTMTVVAWDENGNPSLVVGVISDETDNYQNEILVRRMQQQLEENVAAEEAAEVMHIIASAISGQYYAIYHIWAEKRTYICFTENREGVLTEMGKEGDYDSAVEYYINACVIPEDRAIMMEFMRLDNVKERLREHHSISFKYRQFNIGWTRGTFIAGKRDADGNVLNVIYSVNNINEEVLMEEKRKRAAYEAQHDPLTGLYNRKGFEAMLESVNSESSKVGFAILDIDNFKSLNDKFGHAVGDMVLVDVAKQLTSVFYMDDIVARIGGDEFVVLFRDCDSVAWKRICTKLQTVHSVLARNFKEPYELSITLSAGITFSESGYRPRMYQLADEGLYETKRLGRAGCTHIGVNHEVLNHWQDETLSLLAYNVLEYNNTGVCQIEIPDDNRLPRRLICDNGAKLVMGLPKQATPEECYKMWCDRIDPSYRETLRYTEKSMINDGQIECTFLWNHPDYGTLHMRCGGFGRREADKTILSGYCHILKDTRIVHRDNSDSEGMSGFALHHHKLEKSHASLLAALTASNQLCYEYDPLLHTETCMTDNNFLGMPKCIENYPESLRDSELFYPGDAEIFIRAVREIDKGADSAQCDVRMMNNGEYTWYSCTFSSYYDMEKERKIAILTVLDISLRMATRRAYEYRLQSLTSITESTLCMSIINLTGKTYEVVHCVDSVRKFVDDSLPLEEYLLYASSGIVGDEDRRKFREIFKLENLLQQVEAGNLHLEIEYLLKTDENHYEWIYSAIDMVQNLVTGEITGAIYSRSRQMEKINQMLLDNTLEQDYLFVAAIFVETDEFYLYNYHRGHETRCLQNFWDVALAGVELRCSPETEKDLRRIVVKQYILQQLESSSEYSYAYDGIVDSPEMQGLEIRFSYADAAHTMLLASMRNITDSTLLEKYRHDSEHDSLTDLYNRKTLFRKCRELLAVYPEAPFVMLHIDIRRFRLYNTFFGDAAGDELLCEIADQLRSMGADYEYGAYGRIEADVFAIFFPFNNVKYREQILKIITVLKNYRHDFVIEPAVGMYNVTDRDMPIEAMFTRATLAAKLVRPDTPYATVVFDEDMEKLLRDDQEILSEMQTAIAQEQFQLYLQPKYSLRSDEPIGAEVLARWIHTDKGLIAPSRFIPVFESNGFIATLDRYIWERACRLLNKWKTSGQPLMPVSVNVSRISAYSQDTVPYLKTLVKKYDIDPKYLELELTESAYVESPDEIMSRLAELQEYGFRILMDDFGRGYSSLNTLKDLPIDALKLDMNFLSSGEDRRGSKILVSIIRMSKLLQIPVIAEGVETEAQASYLRSIGCEYVQGYLYARPMPVEDYENLIFVNSESAAAAASSDLQGNTDAVATSSDTQLKSAGLQRYRSDLGAFLDASTSTQLIDEGLAIPLALISYQDDRFSLLRANLAFIDTFELRTDLRPVNQIVKDYLSAESGDIVHRALQKCAETEASVSFRINWTGNDGNLKRYLLNAVYAGDIGNEQAFMISFSNEDPEDYFES